tara:strand:+ start:866 stop:1171 length:306 start_codon:yes stop_codon:yes gene_type:complete
MAGYSERLQEVKRMAKLETREDGLWLVAFGEEHKVLKGWESFSGWYWFATELNDDGNHFGYVQGSYPEWGYFSEVELKSLGNRVWPINECDLPHAGRRGDE